MSVRITITAPRGAGKTYIGKLLEKLLIQEGYTVERLEYKAKTDPALGLFSVQIDEVWALDAS